MFFFPQAVALKSQLRRELELRHDFRRLRRSLKAWYDAVAESLKEVTGSVDTLRYVENVEI